WANGQRLASRWLGITGLVLCDVQLSPLVLVTGARSQGTIVEETLRLQSLSKRPFAVKRIETLGTGLTLERLKSDQAHEARFVVKQLIHSVGLQRTSAALTVQYTDGREIVIRVPISYHGI